MVVFGDTAWYNRYSFYERDNMFINVAGITVNTDMIQTVEDGYDNENDYWFLLIRFNGGNSTTLNRMSEEQIAKFYACLDALNDLPIRTAIFASDGYKDYELDSPAKIINAVEKIKGKELFDVGTWSNNVDYAKLEGLDDE